MKILNTILIALLILSFSFSILLVVAAQGTSFETAELITAETYFSSISEYGKDYYKITVNEGQKLKVRTIPAKNLALGITIYDKNKEEIDTTLGFGSLYAGKGVEDFIETDVSGVIYILVEASSNGGMYTLNASIVNLICKFGETKCEKDNLTICGYSMEKFVFEKTCPGGCEIKEGIAQCKKICAPDDRKCDGKKVVECSEDGTEWGTYESCDYKCKDAACVEAPAGYEPSAGLGALGGLGLLGALIIIPIIFGLAIYVYFALALMAIAKRTNMEKPWFAWIPGLNLYLMTQIAELPWWWLLLCLIPFVGGIISIYICWKIAEKLGRPGWWALLLLIPIVNLIIMGKLAWGKEKAETQAPVIRPLESSEKSEKQKIPSDLQPLVSYIKNAKVKGFSDSEIKEALIKQGWPADKVERAFRYG